MPRIASLSPHEPRGCTLRVTLTTLFRLRLKSRQILADRVASKRKTIYICASGPLINQWPLFFAFSEHRPLALSFWYREHRQGLCASSRAACTAVLQARVSASKRHIISEG